MQPRGILERRREHALGESVAGGGEGGDAVLGIELGQGQESFIVAVTEVAAGVAVGVDVDEAGDDQRAMQILTVGSSSPTWRKRPSSTENPPLRKENSW